MCGRFTLYADYRYLVDRFDIEAAIQEELYSPNYNVAPSQSVISVINDGEMNRLGKMRWGLIPSFAKDEKIGYKMINARAETLTEKPSFRNAYKKRRCLVLADSIYEWKRLDAKTKQPMRIKLKSDDVFAMAGIWEHWKSPTGDRIFSCSVITTTPNEVVADIHDRMPVILQREDEKNWLNPAISDTDYLNQLLQPFPAEFMEAYEVSSLVNSPRNNSPHLIQKIC
ncbi:SOS response-associated peptidase [Bacillus suaedaesalsae]|uniref:Abasic site processing protein n=1 Tax=Bacillus suaedaesalsae TaxID=2810349 RepID=A0ABS2DH91_9BACI|nr:SOS response-associated peptidase [Bacillus suaedaesalsae]MBM6617859.1 SOS response-associated peptidase [Bacillus suaedaesalsae]